MSLTLITAMTSLRVLIGVAGVGYSFFVNKDTEGNFDYGEIPKSIFGETVGGIFYDWLKHGTSAGYDKFLQSLDSFDADALNHDLQRAARKATLLATYFACQACLADIKSERHSIWKRVKNAAWKDEDINWLVAVSKSLRDEIKNVETETFDERINYNELLNIFDKDSIANPKTSQKEFTDKLKEQTLQDIKNGYYAKFGGQKAVPFSQDGFDLLSEAINNGWENFPQDRDFTIQLKLTAHGNQVKKYDWFHLVCVIFNEEYKVNEKIEAAMQKHTALEQTALLKQISSNFQSFGRLENFHDLERQIEDFREENFVYHQITHEKLNEILNLLRGQMRVSSQPLPVHNLPSLAEKVYGRKTEKTQVFAALNADGKRFSLVVAPSGFGKTRLLAKVLQDVTDGRIIKPEYSNQINRIMLIDCRLVRNLTDITRELNTVLGTGLIFENRLRNYNEAWCKLVFELIDGTTWLFLDNFEAWLDASDNYQLINVEIRAFLNALFTGNHGLRGVCLSQSEPESDVLNNLNKLREVGAELFNGLDRDSALLYLRENANADN
ncbi:MAG TPA: hypothetical protein VK892_10020, partial [Pyrinomonadaceae bacterium]|nr:hypothetical protein [Pyrinomonadaceae bacterium]